MQYPDRRSKVAVGGGEHQGSCDAAIGRGGERNKSKEQNQQHFLPLHLN